MSSIYVLTEPGSLAVRYVGRTLNVAKRLTDHMSDARRGKKPDGLGTWLLSLDRAGVDPVLTVVESGVVDWAEAEMRWIAHFRSQGADLLNVTVGGPGHNGAPRSESTKRSLRAANLGKSHGLDARLKMSAAGRGVPKSEVHRSKIQAALRDYWSARKAA